MSVPPDKLMEMISQQRGSAPAEIPPPTDSSMSDQTTTPDIVTGKQIGRAHV